MMSTWDVLKDIAKHANILLTITEPYSTPRATEKFPSSETLHISTWPYDMEGHAKKCVERDCELVNRTTEQLYKVSRVDIRGRIVTRMFTNCLDMSIFGENWQTRFSMVSQQTCTCDRKMDQSL